MVERYFGTEAISFVIDILTKNRWAVNSQGFIVPNRKYCRTIYIIHKNMIVYIDDTLLERAKYNFASPLSMKSAILYKMKFADVESIHAHLRTEYSLKIFDRSTRCKGP